MAYLLDTDVISELRKSRPHGGVVAWVTEIPEEALFVSAVTLGEIQAGIEVTREQDAVNAREIEQWLEDVAETYNVVSADANDCSRCQNDFDTVSRAERGSSG